MQLVPLPAAWRATASPQAAIVEAALRFDADAIRNRPLSLDPLLTLRALAITVMMIGAFWTARDTFARGGIRPVARAVFWAGLVVSILAMATRHATPHLLYGIWPTANPKTSVYGPFVNRNHMGSWLVLALPVTVGYLAARIGRRASARRRSTRARCGRAAPRARCSRRSSCRCRARQRSAPAPAWSAAPPSPS